MLQLLHYQPLQYHGSCMIAAEIESWMPQCCGLSSHDHDHISTQFIDPILHPVYMVYKMVYIEASLLMGF